MSAERTFTIPEWSIGALEKAVRSLARAARRAGILEPSLTINHSTRRELPQVQEATVVIEGSVEGCNVTKSVVPVVDCTIRLPENGFAIHGAWQVLATLERVEALESGASQKPGKPVNEIFTTPANLPKAERYRHSEMSCEHCNAQRVRTKTLVLENTADGTQKQVGKECATFYVGDRAEQMIRELEFQDFVATVLKPFEEIDPFRCTGFGGGSLTAWDAEEIVAHAAACVRENGWEPSSTKIEGRFGCEDRYVPNEAATWRQIHLMLTHGQRWESERAAANAELAEYQKAVAELTAMPVTGTEAAIAAFKRKIASLEQRKWPTPPYTITDEDRTHARSILDWLSAQAPDPGADQYIASLKAAFAPGWISEKKLPLAASIVRAFTRAAELETERQLSARSRHVGQVGARVELTLTLSKAIPYGGAFPGTIYVFHDVDGNSFSWSTSSGYMGSGDVGRTFRFKTTIKEHGEYKGTKTTSLARVKIIEEVKAAEANSEPLPQQTNAPANGRIH